MTKYDIQHLAFSISHGTFNKESPGGCSCEDCTLLYAAIQALKKKEAEDWYQEAYGIQPVAPNCPLDEHQHKAGEFCQGCFDLMKGLKPADKG